MLNNTVHLTDQSTVTENSRSQSLHSYVHANLIIRSEHVHSVYVGLAQCGKARVDKQRITRRLHDIVGLY